MLLGFIGAGGAGLLVALLTGVFRLPVHDAVGTALAAMCFVTVSGTISHYREGNIAPRIGLAVGLAGVIGALLGADAGQQVSENHLKIGAGLALWVLALLVWIRTRIADRVVVATLDPAAPEQSRRQLVASVGLGLSGGAASAFFGVGMAPLLQLGLLSVLKLPLRQTVGTTMLILIFVSASGAASLARHGDVAVLHLIGSVIGLTAGTYLGARYTRRAHRQTLRVAVIVTPIVAGGMLLLL